MRHSSAEQETSLFSFLPLNWLERLLRMKGTSVLCATYITLHILSVSCHIKQWFCLIIHGSYVLSLLVSLYLCFSVDVISTAASTFKDFDLASTQQRPDSVLRRRRRQKEAAMESSAVNSVVTVAQPSVARRFVRLAVMGLTVALGAAALAVVNTALEWAPKLDLFPWTIFVSSLHSQLIYAWQNWRDLFQEPFTVKPQTVESVTLSGTYCWTRTLGCASTPYSVWLLRPCQ